MPGKTGRTSNVSDFEIERREPKRKRALSFATFSSCNIHQGSS
jgi:hypothetical protein